MKKIPTIFKRSLENRREILSDQQPDCAWIFAGEGVPTRKYDGTAVLIQNGKYFKRRDIRDGGTIPADFVEVDYDSETGKRVGWVPVDPNDRNDQWHMEAYNPNLDNGTYELIGVKVNGNPEKIEGHMLVKHSQAEQYENVPRTFEGFREWLKNMDIEGIVFHHPDGRMGKIKKRDYGLKR